MIALPIVLIVLTICFAVWNGMAINWKHGRKPDKFHETGLVVRIVVCIALIMAVWGNVLFMLFWVLVLTTFGFTIYNIIINLMMGQKAFYIGNTSVMDKWFRKHQFIYWGVQVLIIAGWVTLLIIYLR